MDTPAIGQQSISIRVLKQLNRFLGLHIGVFFHENRLRELERGLIGAMKSLGYSDLETAARKLMNGTLTREQIEILSIHLTVGETFFFREPKTFELLERTIIPKIINEAARAAPGIKSRTLRIWSAACSSGDEAYSIAIVLDRLKDKLKDWSVSILASDINISALQKARNGVYGKWAFRGCPDWLITNYFIPRDNAKYEIKPHIKKYVRFHYLNLAEDNFPSLDNQTNAMDVIFCRNVLMYFLPEKARAVVDRLYRSLLPGRWLIVSPTDAFNVQETRCFDRSPENSSVFAKCDKRKHSPTSMKSAAEPVAGAQISPRQKQRPIAIRRVPMVLPGEIYRRALDLYREGNYTSALEVLGAVAGLPVRENHIPSRLRGEIYTLLSRCYANLGQLEHACKWCEKAVLTNKLEPRVHYLQATIYQEMEDYDAALKALKKCLYLDRDFLLAHFTLGMLLGEQDRDAESKKYLDAALSLLKKYGDGEIVILEEGLTAGLLREIIHSDLRRRNHE